MTERFNQTLISMLGRQEEKAGTSFLHPLYMHTVALDMRVQDILQINYLLAENQGYL